MGSVVADWRNATDPEELILLLEVRRGGSRRKVRLFGCAAAQQMFTVLPESSRAAVEGRGALRRWPRHQPRPFCGQTNSAPNALGQE